MSRLGRLMLLGSLLLSCVACGAPSPPKSSFEYSLPQFSTKLASPNFEYVKFGVIGRVSIPKQRAQMKQTLEIGLVNEALRQIQAQAPPGEPTALVNVVILVTEKTQTKRALFTSTSATRSDLELIVRADIVRFTHRATRHTETPDSGAPPAPPKPAPEPDPGAGAPDGF